jgi:serine phosphatase RsbU (regulator of sigma subunit)
MRTARASLLAALAMALAAAPALAQGLGGEGEYYWENPRYLSPGRGRFLSTLPLRGGFVALWQESEQDEGAEGGRIWLSLARFSGEAWESNRRFAGPFEYRGAEPIVYSASASADGRLAVAVADGAEAGKSSIEILLSPDGGRSFERAAIVTPEEPAVAPRIYASATGGWILFAAQGLSAKAAGGAEADPALAAAEERSGSLPIYFASSADGRSWAPLAPLVKAEEGLGLAFLPSAAPMPRAAGEAAGSPARDLVVFQSLTGGDRPSWQLFSKLSSDGGKTWSAARRVTAFPDPYNKDKAGPENFDNQRPVLGLAAGRLWLAWERNLRGASAQIYLAPVDASGSLAPGADRVSSGAGACSDPQVLELQGQPGALWFDNRRGAGRVYMARRRDAGWAEYDISVDSGEASFGRAVAIGDGVYALWQGAAGGADRILVREPDRHADPPRLSALDYAVGKRSRSERATIEVAMPRDSSGIAGYSYVWGRSGEAEPPHRLAALTSQTRLALPADEDGPWFLAVAVEDFAGNWSPTARIRFDRKRRPPPPPILLRPEIDARGFLSSNTFSVDWLPPEGERAAGYTWELRYAGPLEAVASAAAFKPGAAAHPPLPGLSPYEALLVDRAGPPLPPPKILSEAPRASWVDVDDGYYILSVAAIDDVGNVSDAASILLKADKYVPYTAVTYVDASRDELGRTSLKLLGRGFLAEGAIARVVLDRDGREPYDVDRRPGEYRITSDRQIEGFSFEDAQVGSYRVGLYHPKRGWYWTAPAIAVQEGGTVKYGLPSPFGVALKPVSPRAYRFSAYDAIVLGAVLFAALGIVLSLGKVLSTARDAAEVRAQVLALVQGGPMPSEEKAKARRRFGKRGAGLQLKFTLIIASLVIFVVLLVSVPLGYFILRTESRSLATSMQQRADVLLESVAQGARSYLPGKDKLQLGFLPQQARAMDDAAYITLTGYGEGSTEPDVVWATNDKEIAGKIDGDKLAIGSSRIASDALSKDIARIASELDAKAAAEVSDINATMADLTREGRSLATKTDEASRRRFDEIAQTLASLQSSLDAKLFALSTASVGSTPAFDPSALSLRPRRYLFYKPVLYRSGSDQLYYRGMVRLEVSTELIVREVVRAQADLVRIALIIAALALAVGIAGAFILSTIIVVPIRKLVRQIEHIRDTEDKEKLEGTSITVKGRDELFTLADTVNQMTDGLVRAAKASKELVIGKGIQKMFIPLDPAEGNQAALSTGHRDEKGFDVFGYYEGADAVSGDYWDFRPINARYYYFVKCDVSGHGVSAALIMVQVATMVTNYFGDWKKAMPASIDVTDLAYKINDFLEERKFVGRFAAFTLGVWDSQEGIAYLCEAGDSLLHIWSAAKGRLVEHKLPKSPAAGVFPSFMVQMKEPFAQKAFKLEPGDVLFLYTDGIDEAHHLFRDKDYRNHACAEVADNEPHTPHHKGGETREEFGYDRICAVLEALHARGSYRLVREHVPEESLTFDFSGCDGSLSEMIIAIISVEKVFRMYKDPMTTSKDTVVVDAKVDEFLRKKRRFDQARLLLGPDDPEGGNPNVEALEDQANPGYVLYKGVKSDPQDDDLTFLGIRRK